MTMRGLQKGHPSLSKLLRGPRTCGIVASQVNSLSRSFFLALSLCLALAHTGPRTRKHSRPPLSQDVGQQVRAPGILLSHSLQFSLCVCADVCCLTMPSFHLGPCAQRSKRSKENHTACLRLQLGYEQARLNSHTILRFLGPVHVRSVSPAFSLSSKMQNPA